MASVVFLMSHPFFQWKNGADINALQLLRQLRARGVATALHMVALVPTDEYTRYIARLGPPVHTSTETDVFTIEQETLTIWKVSVPAHSDPLALADALDAATRTAIEALVLATAPDAMFVPWGDTQLAKAAAAVHRRVGVFIQNGGAVGPGVPPTAYEGLDLFTVSPMMARRCEKYLRRKAHILFNRVEPEGVVATEGARDQIGMVNICGDKGAIIFLNVAANLSDHRFVTTGGWTGIAEKYATMTTGLTNVEILPTLDDMRPFYGRLRMLLVPSLCMDAFPRVAVEAQLNGIPVVCTDRCGVKNVVSSLVVPTSPRPVDMPPEEYYRRSDLNAKTIRGFLDAVLTVDDDSNHAELAARAKENAEDYVRRQEQSVGELAAWISGAVPAGSRRDAPRSPRGRDRPRRR